MELDKTPTQGRFMTWWPDPIVDGPTFCRLHHLHFIVSGDYCLAGRKRRQSTAILGEKRAYATNRMLPGFSYRVFRLPRRRTASPSVQWDFLSIFVQIEFSLDSALFSERDWVIILLGLLPLWMTSGFFPWFIGALHFLSNRPRFTLGRNYVDLASNRGIFTQGMHNGRKSSIVGASYGDQRQ